MAHKERRRGKTRWVGQVMHNGKYHRKRFDTKGQATAWETETRYELENPTPPATNDTLLDWSTWYLKYARRYTNKVFSEKKNVFKRFFDYELIDPRMPVAELEAGHALAYLQFVYESVSGNRANVHNKNLSAAWNHGVKFRRYGPNPFAEVDDFPHDATGHYVPPVEHFNKVLSIAQGQEKIMLLTYLYTACRRSEAFMLEWDKHVDFVGGRICLLTRKRKDGSLREDWIPMLPQLAEELGRHRLKQPDGTRFVFVQQNGRWKGEPYKEHRDFPQELCVKAKVPEFGCHGIRGLTASVLVQMRAPLTDVQLILRHARLTTTERYVRKLAPAIPSLGQLTQVVGQPDNPNQVSQQSLPPGPATGTVVNG